MHTFIERIGVGSGIEDDEKKERMVAEKGWMEFRMQKDGLPQRLYRIKYLRVFEGSHVCIIRLIESKEKRSKVIKCTFPDDHNHDNPDFPEVVPRAIMGDSQNYFVRILNSLCIDCEFCVDICPDSAIIQNVKQTSKLPHILKNCCGCYECIEICPADAIQKVPR